MNEIWPVIKWTYRQTRPSVFSILLIAAAGGGASLCGVGIAVASKYLIDYAIEGKVNLSYQAAIIFLVLIILEVLLEAFLSVISARTMQKISASLCERIFATLTNSRWLDYSKYHSGDIMTRLTSDIETAAEGLAYVLPEIISLGIRLVAAFSVLLIYEPVLAILILALGPISVLLSRIYGTRLKELHISTQEVESKNRSFLHEMIQNIIILKVFSLEKSSLGKLTGLLAEKMQCVIKKSKLSAGANAIFTLGYWVGYFCAFFWGALHLSNAADSFGTFTAFLQLIGQIQGPFTGLAGEFPKMVATFASTVRLIALDELSQEEAQGTLETYEVQIHGSRLENCEANIHRSTPESSEAHIPGSTLESHEANMPGSTPESSEAHIPESTLESHEANLPWSAPESPEAHIPASIIDEQAAALESTEPTPVGILIKDLYFAYPQGQMLFRSACIEISPGEIAAVTGASGSGKTTFIRLLLALLKPMHGQILLTGTGKDTLDVSTSTRSLISYVPQGNSLFSGTIAENLCIGKPDAGEDELMQAARLSCAAEFIESLPEGLSTMIGERGLGLSEGQAQRLAIARALLREAPVLVFDEATSALDIEIEAEILHNIRNLSPARTCVIVTHRSSAFEICHRVFKLENGQFTTAASRERIQT